MFQTNKYFSNFKHRDNSQTWNMCAMDRSGKFYFYNMNDAYEIAVKMQQEGKRDASLVYFSRTSKTKIFFDIDTLGDLSANQVIKFIQDFIKARFGPKAQQMLVLKNFKYPKYHLYFPQIIVLKKSLDTINEKLNKLLVEKQKKDLFEANIVNKIIDESMMKRETGTLLRLEGFDKYDKHTNEYEPNTYYQIIYPKDMTMDCAFFHATNLLISDSEKITSYVEQEGRKHHNIRPNLCLSMSDINLPNMENHNERKSVQNNDEIEKNNEILSPPVDSLRLSPPVNRRKYRNNLNKNDKNSNNANSNDNSRVEEKDVSDAEDDDANIESLEETVGRLGNEYPELISFLEAFPVRSIKETDDVIIFDLDKSKKGRYCFVKNDYHQNNNQYLVFVIEEEKLFQKCHHADCEHASILIWKNTSLGEDYDDMMMLDDDINEVINTSNDGMARKFAEYFADSWIWTPLNGKCESGFFHYNGILYVKDDTDQTSLGYFLANNFHAVIISELKNDKDKGKITEKQYQKTRKSVKDNLESDSKKRSIIRTLKQYLKRVVEFDTNPYLIVFSNGVYNVETDEFGASSPDQYVSSRNHVNWDFVSFEELDELKFEEFVEVLEDALIYEDEKTTRKQVFGTCLIGEVSRDFGYQQSVAGHSAKSLGTSLVLAVLGEEEHNYGMRAESNTFTNRQDRATFAKVDRKRALIVEEASKYKPLNGNSLDQLLGAGTFTARRFNSSQSHNQAHCTVIINSNDNVEESIHPYKRATKDRTVYIQYSKEYVKFESEVDETKKKFLRNAEYSTTDWMKKMIPYMFHYMAQGAREWIQNRKIIQVSARMQQQMENKPVDGSEFKPWLDSLIVKTDNEEEGVLLSDLCIKFENTQYYESLSAREQRKSVFKRLESNINKDHSLKRCFCKNKYIANKNFRKIIHLHEWKNEDDKKEFSIESKLKHMPKQHQKHESQPNIDQNKQKASKNAHEHKLKQSQKDENDNNDDKSPSQQKDSVDKVFSQLGENDNNVVGDISMSSDSSHQYQSSNKQVIGKRQLSNEFETIDAIDVPPVKKLRT